MLSAFVILLGLCVGSFLNVCIYRLPRRQSIILPPSYCPNCNTPLKPYELIPVVSYLLQGGICRYCKQAISLRYMVVELITGLLFLWCFTSAQADCGFLQLLIFSSFLTVIAFIDYDHQLILDKVLIWFAVTGIAINLYTGNLHSRDMAVAGIAGGGFLFVIAMLTRGGMGGGDIKFVAVLGLWLGLKYTALTLFLSFVTGGTGSLILLLAKVKGRKDFIPFGPFIAVGAFISALYGDGILQWYLQNLR